MPLSPITAESLSPRRAALAAVCLVATFGLLVFTNLGTYPFWGDEADTVIFSHGVWISGDTDARYGRNVYLYRNGTLLEHLKNRAVPPLPYYLAAPFWSAAGDLESGLNAPTARFALRLPFALCGIGAMVVACWWLFRGGASLTTWLCVGGAMALNVSFVLYSRQCRYYGLATFLTAAAAYCYWRFDGRRRHLVGLTLALCCLAAAHYLPFVALGAALVVDFAVWRRREQRLSAGQWSALVVPVAVVFGLLVWVYNPIGKSSLPLDVPSRPLLDKLTLVWLAIRDLNVCECGVLSVLAATPVVAWLRSDRVLIRMFAAFVTYAVAVAVASPQEVRFEWLVQDRGQQADVRYFAAIVPLLAAMTARTIASAVGNRLLPAAALVGICVFSNIGNLPLKPAAWRSTLVEFAGELIHPRYVAGERLAQWLRKNAPPDTRVWLRPNEWCAPQLVHAPHLRYAWQLHEPRRDADYARLPPWHFYGVEPVDIIVLMWRPPDFPREFVEAGAVYEHHATLPSYADDRTRPELYWRWFRDEPHDPDTERIYIYVRKQ